MSLPCVEFLSACGGSSPAGRVAEGGGGGGKRESERALPLRAVTRVQRKNMHFLKLNPEHSAAAFPFPLAD